MSTREELIDVDTMLQYSGDFGRYQYILLFLFSVINVLSAFHYFGQTFISVIPDYKCQKSAEDHFKNVSLEQCSKVYIEDDGQLNKVKCTEKWTYNNSYGYISIIQELNWVCDDAWKPAFGQSIFFAGSVVGTLVFGILADNIGRLHVLVAANLFACVGNLATLLVENTPEFAISRFIAGCATDANFVMMYIIVMEYLRPNMRTFGLNIILGVFYCLGCVLLPWIAVWLQSWRYLLIIISIPHTIVLTFYFLVPESAQWLISKRRTDEAIECFRRIARINRRTISEKHIENLKSYCAIYVENNHRKSENFLGLIKTPKLRRKTFILIYKSMVMTLCYDAISRNVNGLKYSPFLVFSTTSTSILPACLFIVLVQDKIGRKALASGALLLSGIFTATSGTIQAFISNPNPSLIIIFAILGRLGINVAYNAGHQYAVELVPTVVRGQGVSVIHVSGYVASFFSAQILYLSNIWKPAPDVVLGVLLVSGAIACLFLPETLNKTLPVTLQEGEEFGEDEHIFEFACCKAGSESTTQLTSEQFREYMK